MVIDLNQANEDGNYFIYNFEDKNFGLFIYLINSRIEKRDHWFDMESYWWFNQIGTIDIDIKWKKSITIILYEIR